MRPRPVSSRASAPLSELKAALISLVRERGYVRREQAFRLSSGGWSHDYIDGKRAVGHGAGLSLACETVLALATELEVDFDAVGGLTMGADPLAHGVALLREKRWFSVRKEAKEHGRQQRIEGAAIEPGTAVLLVDDVVTTGRSILEALHAVKIIGANVVLAVAMVDRGDLTQALLAREKVRYHYLMSYRDLGIEPVKPVEPGPGEVPASSSS